MEPLVHRKKKFSINFSKVNTKFCLSLHYNADNSYLFVNGKEILKFKTNKKNVNFPTQFCLRSISNRFSATDSRELYKTQEICGIVVSLYSFLIVYCPNKYKTQRMCDEAVDDSLAALKLISDWFVISKMIKNFIPLCAQMMVYPF